jgi:hypothetical protein
MRLDTGIFSGTTNMLQFQASKSHKISGKTVAKELHFGLAAGRRCAAYQALITRCNHLLIGAMMSAVRYIRGGGSDENGM